MPTDHALAGKTILVTGASAGIGAGLAHRLGSLGVDVRLAARRKEKLEEHVAAIRAAGGTARAYACDLASSESVAALFEALKRDGGELDAVVNTAAVLWLEPFATQPEEHWRAILATNLAGAICLTQHALGRMLPRERGHIVHVTSIAGDLAIPYLAIYSTTKAGLGHFLDAMRGEYGKTGVRFTELQIGNTSGTEGGGAVYQEPSPEALTELMRWTGIPDMLEVNDVVEATIYALSTPGRVRLDRIVLRELAQMPT